MAQINWVLSFSISTILAIIGVPICRKVAVKTNFLDHPASHKQHSRSTPYLGGVAILFAVLIPIVIFHDTLHSAIVGTAILILFLVGLYDDKYTMPPSLKLLFQGIGAVLVFTVGFYLNATGVLMHFVYSNWINLSITLILFVLLPNSVNLLDNSDGLAAGVVGASCMGILIESLLRAQHDLAIASAALLGALVGFLAYNKKPASIFMGDAGSLPLGLILVILASRSGGGLHTPQGALISLFYLAIPIADTVTVLIARVTNGRSIFQGGQDHLSHRISASGMSLGKSTLILIGAQLALSTLAGLSASHAISSWIAVALGPIILAAIMAIALRPSISDLVYRQKQILSTVPIDPGN